MSLQFSSVQLLSHVWLFATPWSITNCQSLDPDAGRDLGQEEEGTPEDETAGWHHWLDGHETESTPGVGDGQRGLACCNSWGRKESDTTEWLNWSELNWTKAMSIESVMLSSHLIPRRPLVLLPAIFPNIRVFSNESALHIRWPKYWSFSFNISPSNEHPGIFLINLLTSGTKIWKE